MTHDPKKNSLFDNIIIFGKSLPEILRESGIADEFIDEFRRDFNNSDRPRITDESTKWKISREEGWEYHASPEIEDLKGTLSKGYVPPEERHYDYYEEK